MRILPGALAVVVAGAMAAGPSKHTVAIDGVQYDPAVITVKQGESVTWDNRDPFPHTVTARGAFDSRDIAAGAKWTWVARAPGRYDYICTVHPNMRGTLLVEAR